ncbi:hypothetical protein Cthiooxydans_44960 [Comamonas thiooxydans]|nr:hypothetical protein Cthiooxydans_44960 [Comamonas thiooxydans]
MANPVEKICKQNGVNGRKLKTGAHQARDSEQAQPRSEAVVPLGGRREAPQGGSHQANQRFLRL